MVAQVGQLPPAPSRQDAAGTFNSKADAHLAAQPVWTDEVNAVATEVNANTNSAAVSANSATASEQTSAANANFKGGWSGLTGALNIPASVQHNNKTWMALTNIADVAASEPVEGNADWQIVGISLDTLALIQSIALTS